MAFTGSYICTSFYTGLLAKDFDLTADTLKVALYDDTATLTAATTAYTLTGELPTAGNYTAGGTAVTATITTASTQNGTVVIVDFSDAVWAAATFTTRGALLYDVTNANAAIAVIDFGSNKTFAAATCTVQFPAATANAGFMVFTTVLGQ